MTSPHDIHPPKWPLKFLRFFLRKEYLEEIEGDMEEIFRENVQMYSAKKARRIYTWEMLRLFRPILIRNLENFQQLNQLPMFKNYFKVSIRSLMRSPLNSFINVFGLAVATGICVLAYAFARWTNGTDQFHVHKNEVHLITCFANRDGTLQQYGQTPRPLGEMLKEDFTHVRKVCRVEDKNVVVKYHDHVFHERVRFVDPEFLEMFTFPLKRGTSSSLRDMNSVILSEKMAIKYFGDEDPVGQDILVKFNETRSKAFKVTGVAEKFPDAHTIEFDFLINFENFRSADPEYNFHDWRAAVSATFIEVDKPSDLSSIKQGMEKYKRLQNNVVEEDWAIDSFGFEPLATLSEHSSDIKSDISRSVDGARQSIIFLGIIASFMLALACFNYINIAITTATKRLKEIGVRKTIGATRSVMIVQFLAENMVVAFFALLIGLLLGTFLFIPGLENLNHFDMEFTFNDKNLWIYLPIILFLTGVASGIYPAFYISRFQIVGILKGSVQFGKKNPLTKVFLGVQLVLACILITAGVMFTMNTDYMARRSWGYDQHRALYVAVPDQGAFEKLQALVAREPNILSISGSQHHLGKTNTTAVIRFPDRQVEVDQLSVDANYFQTMGLQLISGRVFRENFESDKKTLVVNKSFVENLGIENPIGQVFKIDSVQYEIIGVVKDFHSYSFFKKVNPSIFRVADKQNYHYLSVRVREGSEMETSITLRSKWAELYPETPFDGGFQEDVWGNYFEQISIHARVWKSFAVITILLASLGLYGLVSLNVAGRTKEFSIRKILGAGVASITGNIGRQYILLFSIALIVGAPLSFALNKGLFDLIYWYHMPIDYTGVILAIGILMLVLLLTVSTQVRKVIQSNPVEGLKEE